MLNNNNTNITNNVNLTENTTSEPSQDSTLDLAKILASLMEDDIPPANPNTTQTDGEHSNACNTDPATCRIEGKLVSENVFNLASRNITEVEIKVFKKGMGFVPTSEKINRWQLKKVLKNLGKTDYECILQMK